MSGWFADATATKRFVLGDCRCEGKPHDEDYMDIRADWSGMFTAEVEASPPAERLRLMVVDWNLDVPLAEAPFEQMYVEVFERLNPWLQENVRTSGSLPNGSGAPSRNGSRASASHTRTIPKRR